ncbi:replication initiation protein [Antarctic microvirus TYR_006_V_SP_13]|nr:replication initiation protein [Antarctic microvirus TYR_006_V_SP_13]
MCLYPRIIKNRKYTATQKNGGHPPPVCDNRILAIPVGCGNCMECRKQKARMWNTRLQEEIKESKNGKFITLTFSDESIKELTEEIRRKANKTIEEIKENKIEDKEKEKIQREINKTNGYGLDNQIATIAVRRWLERHRKRTKKSIKHWLVTELGGNNTERIHLHGIIWTEEPLKIIEEEWKYGRMWKGKEKNGKIENYVNGQTINYMTKYVTKLDVKHKYYKSIILTSAGIGKGYIKSHNYDNNKYREEEETNETYRNENGSKSNLPIYYRNKRYTEEEREKLWIKKIDEQVRYVLGVKIDISNGEEEYRRALKEAQQKNVEMGYNTGIKNWSEEQYEKERRIIKQKESGNTSGGPFRETGGAPGGGFS